MQQNMIIWLIMVRLGIRAQSHHNQLYNVYFKKKKKLYNMSVRLVSYFAPLTKVTWLSHGTFPPFFSWPSTFGAK